MMSDRKICVVCEQAPAVVYCPQDTAYLCAACDHQVHSANALASRHQRVPIEQHVCEVRAEPSSAANVKAPLDEADLPFEDDGLFAVPDVDLPPSADNDPSPFNAKALLGKEYMDDDFFLNEMDPLWLDRLDVGLDRLPSDILDILVPEAPPPNVAPTQAQHAAPQTLPARSLEAPPARPAALVAHTHFMPNPNMVAFAPQPAAFAPPTALKAESSATMVDIDNYVPRTLLPMDPAVRMQLLATRQEKLARFREKKRNRHFKKTIRYASRKAYAEVRPRIKGRFARKDEVAAMRAAGVLPPA